MDFIVERDSEGMPTGLAWSLEIQAAVEERKREETQRFALMRDACTRPMPHLEHWARERGLWQPEAEANQRSPRRH